jgi:hypothetical protein
MYKRKNFIFLEEINKKGCTFATIALWNRSYPLLICDVRFIRRYRRPSPIMPCRSVSRLDPFPARPDAS